MKRSYTVTERFLRYVQIDTQSDPNSLTCPSTEKQKNLGQLLVEELHAMGIDNAEMDEHGYVYASFASNVDKELPAICFCSHMDTSPDCSGKDVKPIVHKNYDGKDIVLPKDHSQVLRMSEHPALAEQLGNDIITADGTTLLGADNKAGIAEIMDAAYQWMTNPNLKHGPIRILFTPDEEIGRGVDKVNLKKLDAQYAYTMDGESRGHIEDETFSADGVSISIQGVASHPGFAKDKMENAIKIASEIIDALPKNKLSPESTSDREGFIHPVSLNAQMESAKLNFIIRDFDTSKLKEHESFLKEIVDVVMKKYPGSSYTFEVQEQYRNMKEVIQHHSYMVDYAVEAIERAGMKAHRAGIRGGTDGSRLSFMGLPCPNIFAGEHAFHSKLEWVSVQDMELAVETILGLGEVWVERH